MRRNVTLIVLLVMLCVGHIGAGQTYQWSGELVALDANAKTMTVKVRLANPELASRVERLHAGERVTLAWSGVFDDADAVRDVTRGPTSATSASRLTLPAQLVSTATTNQYLTIRIAIPESAVASIMSVKPGEWVTVTAQQHPKTDHESVINVRPFVMSAPRGSASS